MGSEMCIRDRFKHEGVVEGGTGELHRNEETEAKESAEEEAAATEDKQE